MKLFSKLFLTQSLGRSFLLGTLLFWFVPAPASAVVPPDFIFNIGAQTVQFISYVSAILLTILVATFEYVRLHVGYVKGHKKIITGGIIGIVIVVSGIWFWHESYLQKVAYADWLRESEEQEQIFRESQSFKYLNQVNPAVDDTVQQSEDATSMQELPLFITNEEFQNIREEQSLGNDYTVLDAREDIEFQNGFFPESLHIRFADLREGRWQDLSQENPIYVICWSGIRGQEVAIFLRERHLKAQYLEHGASGWVDFGGAWQGEIKFGDTYTGDRYQKVFTTEETIQQVKKNVWLVDTREPEKFAHKHISGSINIPLMYTPTEKLEETLVSVPAGVSFITVCDGYVNCFDAKLTGVELERRGRIFLGRYNKPWEYE